MDLHLENHFPGAWIDFFFIRSNLCAIWLCQMRVAFGIYGSLRFFLDSHSSGSTWIPIISFFVRRGLASGWKFFAIDLNLETYANLDQQLIWFPLHAMLWRRCPESPTSINRCAHKPCHEFICTCRKVAGNMYASRTSFVQLILLTS